MYREDARMSQNFDIFVPSLKHSKLLAHAEEVALANEKAKDAQDLKQATDEAVRYFEQYRFWWVNDGEMIFDRDTGLLWQGKLDTNTYYSENEIEYIKTIRFGGLTDWELPDLKELEKLAKSDSPLRMDTGDNRILGKDYWLTQEGRFDTDPNYWRIHHGAGHLIVVKKLEFSNNSSIN